MKAVILSAGLGTRLRPLTEEAPKVMLPLSGKPLLEHHVEYLKQYGIEDICINLHYLPEEIKSYFKNGEEFGVNITYSYEEELRGTAGALNGFGEELNDTFLVQYGDVVSEVDVDKMLEFHNKKSSAATLAIHPTDRPHDSDIVVVNESDRIAELHHKPGTRKFGDLGNAAFYILEPAIFDYLSHKEKEFDFIQDIFPKMIEADEPLYGYRTQEYIKDMGTPERYEKVKQRYEDS